MTEHEKDERLRALEIRQEYTVKELAKQAEQIKMIWRAAFGVLSAIAVAYMRGKGLI